MAFLIGCLAFFLFLLFSFLAAFQTKDEHLTLEKLSIACLAIAVYAFK